MGHNGFTLWFTGLSGSGKTTLSRMVYCTIKKKGYKCELIDGDLVRMIFSKGLGFSKQDRNTNIRRIGFFSHLLARNGVIVIVAAIAPYREVRHANKLLIGDYHEVFCKCPIGVLEKRDAKGLYKKARRGEIELFTGISDIYEEPNNPLITVHTDTETPEESRDSIIRKLQECKMVDLSKSDSIEWSDQEELQYYNKLVNLQFLLKNGEQLNLRT